MLLSVNDDLKKYMDPALAIVQRSSSGNAKHYVNVFVTWIMWDTVSEPIHEILKVAILEYIGNIINESS